jgi:hypothetical protein
VLHTALGFCCDFEFAGAALVELRALTQERTQKMKRMTMRTLKVQLASHSHPFLKPEVNLCKLTLLPCQKGREELERSGL